MNANKVSSRSQHGIHLLSNVKAKYARVFAINYVKGSKVAQFMQEIGTNFDFWSAQIEQHALEKFARLRADCRSGRKGSSLI